MTPSWLFFVMEVNVWWFMKEVGKEALSSSLLLVTSASFSAAVNKHPKVPLLNTRSYREGFRYSCTSINICLLFLISRPEGRLYARWSPHPWVIASVSLHPSTMLFLRQSLINLPRLALSLQFSCTLPPKKSRWPGQALLWHFNWNKTICIKYIKCEYMQPFLQKE